MIRNVLVKFSTGYDVPPIPNKKSGGRRFEKDFIEKRMKFLQKFMSAIIEIINLKLKMKELTSFQTSPYIEELKLFLVLLL